MFVNPDNGNWELKKESNITHPIRFLPRCDICLLGDPPAIITVPYALWHGHPLYLAGMW